MPLKTPSLHIANSNLSSPVVYAEAPTVEQDSPSKPRQVSQTPTLSSKLAPQVTIKEPQLEQVSVKACCSLLAETSLALQHFAVTHIPGFSTPIKELELLAEQISEVKESLEARKSDLKDVMHLPLQQASYPPPSAVATIPDPRSPLLRHPYVKPTTDYVTLEHWLYHLQKHGTCNLTTAWLINAKCDRYLNIKMNPLNMLTRRPKLIEMGFNVRNAWVYLMLYLSTAISEKQSKVSKNIGNNLNKLAVATGQVDFQDLKLDDAKQLYMQGDKYFLGYGVQKSYDLAFKRYEAAAKFDLPEAYTMLGTLLEFGFGRDKNMVAATNWYQKAAQRNFPDALNHMGRLHEAGKGVELSMTAAFNFYQRAAKSGHLDGLTQLGHLLEHGKGCTKDLPQAFDVYRTAAEQNYARAQNALGSCYYQGKGAKKDYLQAVTWFRKAADNAYTPAYYNLGICHEQGHGVMKDSTAAKIFYKRAADMKHPNATCSLAYMLFLEHNYMEAINNYHIAVSLGCVDASYHLGTLYEAGCSDINGVVLNRDVAMALRYFEEAAKHVHSH
jgi:TPR repeat protein